MAPTGEEIRHRLTEFAAKWSVYSGSERSEAQTFLNELFSCFGTDRSQVARFEDPQQGKFLDLIWDRVCIIEMKRPSEAAKLSKHRKQALDYWRNSADPDKNLPAPRYVVLCAFTSFEIWEPGQYPNEPRAAFDIHELPDRVENLIFLADSTREPLFLKTQEAVTREAVSHVTTLYERLSERRAAGSDVLRDFILQSVWTMFAEDLGQIEGKLFTRILQDLIESPKRSSADDIGGLFEWLNKPGKRPTEGLYAGVPYANGGLFKTPARVHLNDEELEELLVAARDFDWKRVEPHIFGSLMEGMLGKESRKKHGAHYTYEVDIQKVVIPSIVDPWRERIENASKLAEIKQLQEAMLNYVVLDPACGSGNFLYIAYRELRRLEKRLHDREREMRRGGGLKHQQGLSAFFPLTNILGIELNAFAVELARVSLWMAHKLAVDELELTEATLPLEDLSGIQSGDALRMDWPRCDVIIGNPPFHGDRSLRGILGEDYIEWLKQEFNCGVKDHCVYWFRKAHDHLEPGQRAGLVGTNSISQNRARDASLDYIVERGGVITDAVSTQEWPGEATVEVSIVNWIKRPAGPPTDFILDGGSVDGISTSLTDGADAVASAGPLKPNAGIAFQGFLPGAKFDITIEKASELLKLKDASYREVVLPYLGGEDITKTTDQRPTRYTIDFAQMALEDAMAYPAALDTLREQAKEKRESSNSYSRNPHWWQFLWPRPEFRTKAASLPRFISGTRVAKRITFVWCEPAWRPSDSTNIFALAEDFHIGVLSSDLHFEWARAQSSTLRLDIRYTPSSAFETFPWPSPDGRQREAVATAARALLAERKTACTKSEIGLTTVYNQMEEGAWQDLRKAHEALDKAVLAAYGWSDLKPGDVRETNQRLVELNAAIARGEVEYSPFDA